MAKSKFTKHFQNNLEIHLDNFIQSKPALRHLEVHSEYRLKFGGNKNEVTIIDLAIIDPESKGHKRNGQPEKMVAIEIEVFNNPRQIFRNYVFFRNYIRGGSTRVGGIIMLVSNWANINEKKFNNLLENKHFDEEYVNGFKSEFHDLLIDDMRKTDMAAIAIIESISFKRKLKEMILNTHGISYW